MAEPLVYLGSLNFSVLLLPSGQFEFLYFLASFWQFVLGVLSEWLASFPLLCWCHVVCFSESGRSVLGVFWGGQGRGFSFQVVESNISYRSFIKLRIQEHRWMAIEMVRLLSSKGEPLRMGTFKGANRCLLLQLRKNVRGRFIVFSLFGGYGRSKAIIFPEGSNLH